MSAANSNNIGKRVSEFCESRGLPLDYFDNAREEMGTAFTSAFYRMLERIEQGKTITSYLSYLRGIQRSDDEREKQNERIANRRTTSVDSAPDRLVSVSVGGVLTTLPYSEVTRRIGEKRRAAGWPKA